MVEKINDLCDKLENKLSEVVRYSPYHAHFYDQMSFILNFFCENFLFITVKRNFFYEKNQNNKKTSQHIFQLIFHLLIKYIIFHTIFHLIIEQNLSLPFNYKQQKPTPNSLTRLKAEISPKFEWVPPRGEIQSIGSVSDNLYQNHYA